MSKPTLRTAIAVCALAATALVALPLQSAPEGSMLVVYAAAPFRPVTHAASGGLYALAEDNRPADSLLLPIKVHTLTQPPGCRRGARASPTAVPLAIPPGRFLMAPPADRRAFLRATSPAAATPLVASAVAGRAVAAEPAASTLPPPPAWRVRPFALDDVELGDGVFTGPFLADQARAHRGPAGGDRGPARAAIPTALSP